MPFQGSVPWQDLSVKWPMHEVAHGLYDYLKSSHDATTRFTTVDLPDPGAPMNTRRAG